METNNNKKAIIKKKINKLLKAAPATLLAATIAIGVYHVSSEIALKDNSSIKQVSQYQEEFDVVSGYQHTNGERLKHNGDEPIYIQIDEKFSAEQKETMIQALDFIFGLVGDINDNYRYEIVDDVNQLKYFNKTKINYSIQDKVIHNNKEVYGLYTTYLDVFKSNKKGEFINKGNVDIENENASDLDELYFTTLHETFHLFGVKDVYFNSIGETYNNTFINVGNRHTLKMITPNDYKLLISLYAKDLNELKENERQEYISQLEQKIEDYTFRYYSHYQEAHKQDLIKKGFSAYDVMINTTYVPLENDIDVTFTDTISTKGISAIRVKVKGDKYVIATYDENNNLLESCMGKAYHVGGQIFLHNVELKNLKKGSQTYADLCVEMHTNNTKYYRLRDIVDTIYSAAGINTELYQEQNQDLLR